MQDVLSDLVHIEVAEQRWSVSMPRIDLEPTRLANRAVRQSHPKPPETGAVIETLGAPELERSPERCTVHPFTVVKNSNGDLPFDRAIYLFRWLMQYE